MIRVKPDVKSTIDYKSAAAARIMDVSDMTIVRAIKSGKMTAKRKKNDRHVYISGSEILKYWEQHRY